MAETWALPPVQVYSRDRTRTRPTMSAGLCWRSTMPADAVTRLRGVTNWKKLVNLATLSTRNAQAVARVAGVAQ